MVLKISERKSINLIENVSKDMRKLDSYDQIGVTSEIFKKGFNSLIEVIYDSKNRKFISNNVYREEYDKFGYYFPVGINIRGNSNLYNISRRYKVNSESKDLLLELQKEIKSYVVRVINKYLSEISQALITDDSNKIAELYSLHLLDDSYITKDCVFKQLTSRTFDTKFFFNRYRLTYDDISYFMSQELNDSQINILLNNFSRNSFLNDLYIDFIYSILNKVFRKSIPNIEYYNYNKKVYNLISNYINNDKFYDLFVFIFSNIKNNKKLLNDFIESLIDIKHFSKLANFFKKEVIYLNSSFIINNFIMYSNLENLFKEVRSLDIYSIAKSKDIFKIDTDMLKSYNVSFSKKDVKTLRNYANSNLELLNYENTTSSQIDLVGNYKYMLTISVKLNQY